MRLSNYTAANAVEDSAVAMRDYILRSGYKGTAFIFTYSPWHGSVQRTQGKASRCPSSFVPLNAAEEPLNHLKNSHDLTTATLIKVPGAILAPRREASAPQPGILEEFLSTGCYYDTVPRATVEYCILCPCTVSVPLCPIVSTASKVCLYISFCMPLCTVVSLLSCTCTYRSAFHCYVLRCITLLSHLA